MEQNWALSLKDVSKSFNSGFSGGKKEVLKKLTFQVSLGEVYGFLGNNGSGKTTTIKMILGLVKIDSGVIQILGEIPGQIPLHKIGFAQERTAFYPHLTAMETLIFYGQLSGMEKTSIQNRGKELLQRVHLDDRRDDLVKTFSKGMKQRLGLAAALIHEPELIILDEPATGLDPFGRKLVTDLILEEKFKGKTIFFSSHNLDDVEKVCDRFGILSFGTLKWEMTPQQVTLTKGKNGIAFKNLEEFFLEHQEPKGEEGVG